MNKYKWIRNPLVDNPIAPEGFTSLEAEQFINLSSDFTLKSIYSSDSITFFWITAQFEFPLMSCTALHILIQGGV